MEWIASITVTSIIGVIIFLSKNIIITKLKNAVKHEYDEKIENIKSDLRKAEIKLQKDLDSKEQQLISLKTIAFTNVGKNKSLLFEKRLNAAEKLWVSIGDLSQAKGIAKMMSILKVDEIEKTIENNRSFMEQLGKIGTGFDLQKLTTVEVGNLRPFLSPMLWALYSAYAAILSNSVIQLEMLKNGLTTKFIDKEYVKNLVTAVLPHQTEVIKNYDVTLYYYLLEEIELLILKEINLIILNEEQDKKDIIEAMKILKEIDIFNEQSQAILSSK